MTIGLESLFWQHGASATSGKCRSVWQGFLAHRGGSSLDGLFP